MSLLTNIRDAFSKPVLRRVVVPVAKKVFTAQKKVAVGAAKQTGKGLKILGGVVVNAPPTVIPEKTLKYSDTKNSRSVYLGTTPAFDYTGMVGATGNVIKKIPEAAKGASRVFREPVIRPISELSARTRQALDSRLPQTLRNTLLPQVSRQQLPQELPSTGGGLSKPPKIPSSLGSDIPQPFNPDKYVSEQVARQEKARNQGKKTLIGQTKSFLANVKAQVVDSTSPIEDVLAGAIKKNKIKLLPKEDIRNQIDRVLRAPTIAGQFAKDNGIVEVIKGVDNPDALDQFMIAKHAVELNTRGVTTGRNLKNDEQLVQALAPKYQELASKVSDYSKKLLDYSAETGLVSKELAAKLRTQYPDYVPFNRIFSEAEETGRGTAGGVASLSRQTVVQKIKGSVREIESPLQSLLAKTNDVFKQGEKNRAAQMLASYEKLPGNPFNLKELDGFVDDATGKTLKTFDDKAKDTISFFEDGVKRTFQTTPEIAKAAKSLNVQQMNVLQKVLAFPVRVARLGLTGINIPFVASNIVKDQVSAFVNTNKAMKTSIANPVNFFRSLLSAVKHDDLYDDLVRAGGGGTSYDLARSQVDVSFDKIRSTRNLGSRILYTVSHPGDLLRAVEDIVSRSEELTRIQQFRGTRQALLKEGMDAENATIAAAKAARENTVNFARRGEWGTVLNSTFLYLNAGIQGTRTLLRNLKTKPVATSAKIAVSTLFPVASVTAWNLSDPERRAAYEDIPDYEKENNIIIIPPSPTQDEDGKWNVIKIPLSPEIRYFANGLRQPLEAAHGLDPVKFKDVAKNILGIFTPVNPLEDGFVSQIVPQAVKPAIESRVNKNLFTGSPLIPRGLENLSPENQVKKSTSGTARKLGGLAEISPIRVEEFIKGTFGGVGSQALNASDRLLNKAGVVPEDQIGGTSISEGITKRFAKAAGGRTEDLAYTRLDEAARKKADYKAKTVRPIYDKVQTLKKAGNEAEAQQIVDALSDKDYEIYKSIRTAEKTKNTTALERQLLPTYERAQLLLEAGDGVAAQALVDALTDEEYHAYTLLKKKLQ